MYSTSLVLAVCLVVSITALIPADQKFKVYEDCAKKHPISKSSMQGAFDFTSAAAVKESKCFIYCVDDSYGLFKKDGSFNKEVLLATFRENFQKPEDQQKVIAGSTTCLDKQKVLPDKCDYANALFECFVKEIKNVIGGTKYTTYNKQ